MCEFFRLDAILKKKKEIQEWRLIAKFMGSIDIAEIKKICINFIDTSFLILFGDAVYKMEIFSEGINKMWTLLQF